MSDADDADAGADREVEVRLAPSAAPELPLSGTLEKVVGPDTRHEVRPPMRDGPPYAAIHLLWLQWAPGEARIRGADARTAPLEDDAAWFDVLPRTRLQPDTAHRFRLDAGRPMTHARVDIYPDGGLARVRLHGSLTADGERDLLSRWRARR